MTHYDALTNPPMPDWNDLTNEERSELSDLIDGAQCSCQPKIAHYAYGAIKKVLKVRERRYLAATMAGPPAEHFALSGDDRNV